MGHSLEWHIRAPQALALELLQQYWWEQGCTAEVTDGPQDGAAFQRYQDEILDETKADLSVIARLLVCATDSAGWTIARSVYGGWNDALWRHLTWDAQALILVGEDDTRTGWSRWAWYEYGRLQAEHVVSADGKVSSIQASEYEQPNQSNQPDGALALEDAFAAVGRVYRTLPLAGCQQLLVRGNLGR